MNQVLDLIKKEKKMQGKSWQDLAKGLPVSHAALSAAFSRNKISNEYLEHIAKELNIFDKEEYKQSLQSLHSKVSEPSLAYTSPAPKNLRVPYYNIDFTASFVESFNSQQIQPDSFITHPFFEGCDYIVRNSGQSMAKLIKHGDAIGLKKVENWQEFLPLGEIYAIVTTNGFRMIKIITAGQDNDHYTLVSKPTDGKKEEFPDQQIKKSMILHIFRVEAASHQF
mgnify:CR=1 FL=1